MKKLQIFSAIALTFALAACDNFELPNPPAQSNPDPGIDGVFENSGLKMSKADKSEIVLEDANAANVNVAVAKIDELVNFPEGYDLRVDMQVAKDNSFGKYATVETVISDDIVYVNPVDFDAAIAEAITKSPAKLNLSTRFVAYAERESTLMRLGGVDAFYGQYDYSVTPLNPDKVLEQEYYLVGNFCNWDPKKGVKMANSIEGANIYDNPIMVAHVNVTEEQAAAGYEFKIVPASSALAGTLDGAIGFIADETGLAGKLVEAPSRNSPVCSRWLPRCSSPPTSNSSHIRSTTPLMCSIPSRVSHWPIPTRQCCSIPTTLSSSPVWPRSPQAGIAPPSLRSTACSSARTRNSDSPTMRMAP